MGDSTSSERTSAIKRANSPAGDAGDSKRQRSTSTQTTTTPSDFDQTEEDNDALNTHEARLRHVLSSNRPVSDAIRNPIARHMAFPDQHTHCNDLLNTSSNPNPVLENVPRPTHVWLRNNLENPGHFSTSFLLTVVALYFVVGKTETVVPAYAARNILLKVLPGLGKHRGVVNLIKDRSIAMVERHVEACFEDLTRNNVAIDVVLRMPGRDDESVVVHKQEDVDDWWGAMTDAFFANDLKIPLLECARAYTYVYNKGRKYKEQMQEYIAKKHNVSF